LSRRERRKGKKEDARNTLYKNWVAKYRVKRKRGLFQEQAGPFKNASILCF
jgi:hypothetical protein